MLILLVEKEFKHRTKSGIYLLDLYQRWEFPNLNKSQGASFMEGYFTNCEICFIPLSYCTTHNFPLCKENHEVGTTCIFQPHWEIGLVLASVSRDLWGTPKPPSPRWFCVTWPYPLLYTADWVDTSYTRWPQALLWLGNLSRFKHLSRHFIEFDFQFYRTSCEIKECLKELF